MIYETPLSRMIKVQQRLPTGEIVTNFRQIYRISEKTEQGWRHWLTQKEIEYGEYEECR